MANAAFGYTNLIETGTLSAGSEVAGLNVSNLKIPQGSSASSWQTGTGVVTSAGGAWFTLDMGTDAAFQAFLLARTSLTSSAQVRWRVGPSEGLVETNPTVSIEATSPITSLPAGWAWARTGNSGTATYWDSAGTLTVAATNTIRPSYDPVSLTWLGLLIEPTRTNAVRNPRAEGSTAGTPGTAPTNWTIAVAGGLDSQIIGTGTESGMPYIDVKVTGTAVGGGSSSIAIYTETTTGIATANSDKWAFSHFHKYVGTPTNPPASITHFAREYASGVYNGQTSAAGTLPDIGAALRAHRSEVIMTMVQPNGSTTTTVQPVVTYYFNAGTTDVTVRFSLPQAEKGSWASNPILPLAGTPAASTRNTDTCTYTLTATQYANGATIYWEHITTHLNAPAVATEAGAIRLEDSANTGVSSAAIRTIGFSGAGGSYYDGRIIYNSSAVYDGGNYAVVLGPDIVRSAIGLQQNSFFSATNGVSGLQDNTGDYPAVLNRVRISSGEAKRFIRSARVWDQRLSNGQITALSDTSQAVGSTIDTAALAFDSGMVGAGVAAGYGQSVFFSPTPAVGRYVRCDIDDPGNPDGFIAVGLAFAGPVWQPEINMSWDSSTNTDARIDEVVTRGGQEFPQFRFEQRRWDVGLEHISIGDLWTEAAEVHRAGRRGANILFIPDPASEQIQREAVFGRASSLSDFTYSNQQTDYRSWKVRITERL